jgi:hypothetical protein
LKTVKISSPNKALQRTVAMGKISCAKKEQDIRPKTWQYPRDKSLGGR